jgi:hypothetical protein
MVQSLFVPAHQHSVRYRNHRLLLLITVVSAAVLVTLASLGWLPPLGETEVAREKNAWNYISLRWWMVAAAITSIVLPISLLLPSITRHRLLPFVALYTGTLLFQIITEIVCHRLVPLPDAPVYIGLCFTIARIVQLYRFGTLACVLTPHLMVRAFYTIRMVGLLYWSLNALFLAFYITLSWF